MILRRALIVWLIIMCVEFIHGILRTVLLVPQVGDFQARQIAVFSGSILIFIITCLLVRWMHADTTRALVFIGFVWLVLTLLFELSFGRFVLHLPWHRLLEDYNIVRGGLLPFGMIFLTFSPLIAAKLRGVTFRDYGKPDVLPESEAMSFKES
jgi:hypothetical protein